MPSVRLALPLLVACVTAAGCVSNVRPAVLHNMEMMPSDRQKTADQLDAAQARPTPETRAPLPRKLQKVELGVASAAAILGWMFSSTDNTVLGISSALDSPGSDPGTAAPPPPPASSPAPASPERVYGPPPPPE